MIESKPRWPVLPAVLQRRLAKISSNHLRALSKTHWKDFCWWEEKRITLRMYKNHCNCKSWGFNGQTTYITYINWCISLQGFMGGKRSLRKSCGVGIVVTKNGFNTWKEKKPPTALKLAPWVAKVWPSSGCRQLELQQNSSNPSRSAEDEDSNKEPCIWEASKAQRWFVRSGSLVLPN